MKTPNMARQVFQARARLFKARILCRKKRPEDVSPTSHATTPLLREMPIQGGAPDPAGTPWFQQKNGPSFLQGVRRLLAWPLLAAAKNSGPIPLIVLSVFLLSRPYGGIVHDAHIYIGRALADLDPNGVGRDIMFVYDGQFGFSLFRQVADGMVTCFEPGTAAKTLAVLAAFAWLFGIRVFARQFASGATVWVAVIFFTK
jgi:hypothetical protein